MSNSDLGGDPACWLDRVCPDCGAFLPDGPESGCPRCARLPQATPPEHARTDTPDDRSGRS
ncbi:hypothetical protein FK531_20195 [Rhodococcus spelaei]|uniref:Uncharacterized protein n=1 Tax=Rhodococcus spelaei TaxID=2546320 RepID=A0A541B0B1_9NOCA|nr:hypothetical protein FK531_20195 [Rhodococcus spelaei]